MKKIIILALLSTSVFAGNNGLAKVINVQPNMITQTSSTPQKVCTDTTTNNTTTSGTTTGKVAGGVIGGVIGAVAGNQVSQGGGGTAIGAVSGALIGGFAGNSLSQTEKTTPTTTTSCTTQYVQNSSQVQKGYLVTYSYNGSDTNTMVMEKAPTSQYINVYQAQMSQPMTVGNN